MEGTSEAAATMAKAIHKVLGRKFLEVATCLPVIIRTVQTQEGGTVPYRVTVQPKNIAADILIPDLPVVFLNGGGHSFIHPVSEGDVGLAFFSHQTITDLIVSKDAVTAGRGRNFNLADSFVLVGFFVDNDDLPNSLYQPGDTMLVNEDNTGFRLRGTELHLGKLDGTLKDVLVDGDSGSDPQGGSVTINSSQSNVKVGT